MLSPEGEQSMHSCVCARVCAHRCVECTLAVCGCLLSAHQCGSSGCLWTSRFLRGIMGWRAGRAWEPRDGLGLAHGGQDEDP